MSSREGETGDQEYASRAKQALRLVELRGGGDTIRQDELARLVSGEAGETIPQPYVSRWLGGSWPRTQRQRLAWARVLRADPGWLYFGDASQAPAPEGWREPERPATERPKGQPAPVGVAKPRSAKGAAAKGARRRSNG